MDRSKDMTEAVHDIEPILARYPDLELAYVFGSVARGEAGADSDLDLAVRMPWPLGAERKLRLIEELASATGRPVDLVDLHTVGEPLLGEILSGGVRLVGSSEDHAALVTRHLLDEADFMPYVRRLQAERRARWMQ
jgi:predicted nucleotidyltransferase